MKNILSKLILLTGVGLFGLQGALLAQQAKNATDSLENARLAQRSALFMEKMAQQQRNLQSRALALNIPMLLQKGEQTYALREITPSGEPVYDAPDNLVSVQTISANNVKAGGGQGLALTGAGQTLGLWEAFQNSSASVRNTHDEFGGRVTLMDGGGFSSHGTHVAGTMIAAGVDPNAAGFSSGADLISYDITNDVAEMDAAAKAATPIRISNHSYGSTSGWTFNNTTMVWDWNGSAGDKEDWKFGAYNNSAQAWDEVAFNNPFLTIFKSSGNDRGDGPGTNPMGALADGGLLGFDCIPTYGTAKNIVTVGAINGIAGGYSSPAGVTMSSFSGWGPTDDGRIKPDIVADGVSLYSSEEMSDSDYGIKSGTSMSTPSAAGGSGLLLEHWGNIIGGAPRSATLKGLLIEMADECGGAIGPDYSFGWGMVNIADAAQLITIEGYDGCQQYVEGSVGDGDVFTHDVYSDGSSPIKVTLSWTDVQSSATNNGTINPGGANYLVNNLDLRVDGGGTTAMPWVLDPANPTNAAFPGDNNRDNVEQVLILHPTAGVYTIRVIAPATVTDGPQRFTLWFSGNGSADEDITVSGVNINSDRTFSARRNAVFGPLPVNVTAPAHARAYAGKSVRLQPGFHAFAGSTFLAKILPGGGCGIWSGDLKTDNYIGAKAVVLGDGERTSLSTPVNTIPGLSLALSPNPTTGLLNAHWQLANPFVAVTLRILDQNGREVSRQYVDNTTVQAQMDVSTLAPGVYSCVVENGVQREATQFVIVK
jgi:hypothetical protein